MFKKLILDYYYLPININSIAINFNQVCYLIKIYFKKTKYKQIFFK